MSNLITVGTTALPEPSTYTANTATLVDSARNVKGKMIGSVIRDDVAKIEMSWKYLTTAQWATINELFTISNGGSFTNSVTYYDQTTGTFRTKTMYVSDRDAGMWRRTTGGTVLGWTDCKLSLVEV